MSKSSFQPSFKTCKPDDAGSDGVSFICDDETDLDASADTTWRPDNVWTSFVACPAESVICGFETKGSTAFPDNTEITRVKFFCCNKVPLE